MLSMALLALLLQGCQGRKALPQPDADAPLREALAALCDNVDGRVGVAAAMADGRLITFGDTTSFPLLSVVKFPQAIALCRCLDEQQRTLDDTLHITSAELLPDTWSPLRDEHPAGGTFTIGELLRWSLVMSDNNACDILFHRLCSVGETEARIHALGFTDCHIEVDEQAMRSDLTQCYRNAVTPATAVQMLQYLYAHRDETHLSTVWEDMALCQTGQHRIPAGVLHDSATVVHKTGTGPVVDGRLLALNDAGIVLYPDGTQLTLAIFVSDAALTADQAEALIAAITRTITRTARAAE